MPLKMFMINVPDGQAEKIADEINHTLWIFFAGSDHKYEPIFAICENGEFIQLTKDASWESNPIFSSLKKAKTENRWDICVRHTMKMVAEGVEAQLSLSDSQRIAQKLSRMPKLEVSAKMNELMFVLVANYLSQVYGEISTAINHENTKRKNLSAQLEYYISSGIENDTPFSREAKPHETYPALRIKGNEPLKAIVCVDVNILS